MPESCEKKGTDSPAARNTKVAIVEDQRSLCDAFSLLIDGTEGFQCTGTFRTMEEALEKLGSNLPDVVLADIGLPGMDGIEGVRRLKEHYPELTVLMLTIYDDDDRIFDALCAGARSEEHTSELQSL